MKPEFRHSPNLHEACKAAAELVCSEAHNRVREHGVFSLVLSGGTTPRPLYEYLADEPFRSRMPWDRTHLFWGDERFVAADDPGSNFAMAFEAVISKVPIPAANVHQVPVDLATAEDTACAYEQELIRIFREFKPPDCSPPSPGSDVPFPTFDLILLGLGSDGHTASLFPGSLLLDETVRWIASVPEPTGSPPVPRITLTLPAINQARLVLFLVSGNSKRRVVKAILDDPLEAAKHYPAARVHPQGKTIWFHDIDLGEE
jgi:6-phosphogluconolactonase